VSSEIRSLPPRVQQRDLDNTEGSIRISRQFGTRGAVNSASFNDVNVLVFTGSSVMDLAQGLPISTTVLSSTYYLTGAGTVRKGVGDKLLTR
jgi:hypothetical protein